MQYLNHTSKAQLLFLAERMAQKEKHQLRIDKPYFRTTAYRKNHGWKKRVQRRYVNNQRISVYKIALRWVMARLPIT
jgi:hypothetical protein